MAKIEEKVKSTGGIPLLVGAVGFGLVAALLAFVYLKSREAALEARLRGEEVEEVAVVVAARDLPRGTMISKENFAARRVPVKYVHDDAVFPGEFDDYVGQAITANVGRGKPLLKSFMDREFPVDFSDIIDVGRRAMTLQVDEVNSVAGFIRPGNRIDLFVNIPFKTAGFDPTIITSGVTDELPATVKGILPPVLTDALESAGALDQETIDQLMSSAAPSDVIMPVLQNVKVLATGRDPYRENLDNLRYPQQRTERTFSTVTLDVSPEQAALLAAAEDKGDLLALLRNRDDASTAEFPGVSATDLFDNAVRMAEQEATRASRVSTPAGTDLRGNLVDADGNQILSREQLEAAGYRVNAKGEILDENGNVVDPKDIAVTADGKIVDKAALAAQGYTVNDAGQIVDKNGRVVDANDLVVTEDGRVLNKKDLEAAGLTVNEDGEIVDAKGQVVDPDSLVTTADGKVFNREQLAEAGLTVDENGQLVDSAGNPVDTRDLAKVTGGKLVQTPDGRVLSSEQLEAAGLSVNENGEIVDADGNVVDPSTIAVTGDGQVVTRDQLAKAGLSVNENGEIVDARGNVVDPARIAVDENGEIVYPAEDGARTVDLIIGGDPTDGVAKSTSLRAAE